MRGKQVVKKIAALTAGLSMVGATIFGASAAADLADYPSPLFIQDGKFNAFIVVGANAASMDVVGSIEMATSLQVASVKKKVTSGDAAGSSETFEVSNGFMIERSGDNLLFGKYVADVQDTNVDDTDMPVVLKDGTYDDDEGNNDNEASYDQEIKFAASNVQVLFHQDDSNAPVGQPYLYIDDSANAYTYILEFNEDITYDNTSSTNLAADVEDTELELVGQTFTIIDASGTSTTNRLNKVTLLAGETVMWLAKDEPISRVIDGVEYEITLAGVNNNEDKCSLIVGDTTLPVNVGQTKSVGGIEIGVSDAIHSDTGLDNCKVNVGATKVILKDGDEVDVNGKDLDGTTVGIGLAEGNKWHAMNVTVRPKDDTYLAAGESWTDPVFGAFKLTFGGMTVETEEYYKFSASGNDADLVFKNLDGKEVKLEYTTLSNDTIILGDGTGIDDRIYLEGEFCDFTSAVDECEDAQFLVISSGGEAHLMEISNFDTTNNKVDIKDITYGSTNKDEAFNEAILTAQNIALSSGAGTIQLQMVNETGGTGGTAGKLKFTDIDLSSSGAKTDGQAYLVFYKPTDAVVSAGSGTVKVLQFTEDAEDDAGGMIVTVNMSVDSDSDINVLRPRGNSGDNFVTDGANFDVANDDDKWYVSNWSTRWLHDSKDKTTLEWWYPKKYQYGKVFLSEVSAGVSEGGAVEVTELQPIQVGAAKLDTEVSDVTANNLIVIGGPCANSVAAELMELGADDNCAEGFTEGEAMIKLFENGDNVALLVAGYEALDTRRATRVLANYKDYADDLKGSEVVVKGTTLSDIRVSTPETA